jgi:hypothetical protein
VDRFTLKWRVRIAALFMQTSYFIKDHSWRVNHRFILMSNLLSVLAAILEDWTTRDASQLTGANTLAVKEHDG